MDNIDINFLNLNRHQVLTKYADCVRQLRTLAEQTCNVRALQFDNYLHFQYFQQRRSVEDFRAAATAAAAGNYTQQIAFIKTELLQQLLDRRRKILYWLFYLLLVFVCVSYKNEASSAVVRNIQTFIYPGMKMWRKMTLPVIKRFPGLTELYDESCLMMNPFFQVDDLNCEPCANVQSVLDLTVVEEGGGAFGGSTESSSSSSRTQAEDAAKLPSEFVPFVFKIKQDPIQLDDFYNIYTSNYEIFQRDAYRVHSTNHEITNLAELFQQFNNTQRMPYAANARSSSSSSSSTSSSATDSSSSMSSSYSSSSSAQHQRQSHNMWRCNRMLPARLLRGLFARPARLPSTGIALERYMSIDTAHAPSYTLPDTECANVYVQQALGTRFIILRPTSECRHRCRTLSVRLPQSFVLSYNWWYWKPISAPDPLSDTLSLSLIGSYC